MFATLHRVVQNGFRWRRKVFRHRWRRFRIRLLIRRAERHRLRLPDVTFVAVTGSIGKTMARELITAIVSSAGPCARNVKNTYDGIAAGLLATRRSDRFCVMETPTTGPGYIDRNLRMVRPSIGVVTSIGTDHRAAFGTIDAIAQEKGKLVEGLPPDGVAVLNADDPRVLAMRTRTAARVITYGCSPDAMVRGENIIGTWPDRLSLTVRHGGEAVAVQTRLCGTHWAPSVLAAMAAGLAAGVPLATAAAAIGRVEPFPGRMCPVVHDDGVTFIRDDTKASVATVVSALAFLKSARAARKVAIIGSISDYSGDRRRVYTRMARAAREAADLVVWVGPFATMGLAGRRHAGDDAVAAFTTVRDASAYLNGVLKAGDLVLLKGSLRADHLLRIVLARTSVVRCWRNRCGKSLYCDDCPSLTRASPGRAPSPVVDVPARQPERPAEPRPAADIPVVVGLGNPEARYAGTPHNVGQAVIDRLAATLDMRWSHEGGAAIARANQNGGPWLIKLDTPINGTGPVLKRLGRELGFDPTRCVLVHDDVALPIGRVRVRMGGSSGGHRGVASILQEFQSEAFRRVKVGVARADGVWTSPEFLLMPFSDETRPVIDAACDEAAQRVLDLLAGRPPAAPHRRRASAPERQ